MTMEHSNGRLRLGMILLFMPFAGCILAAGHANAKPCSQNTVLGKKVIEASSRPAAGQLAMARSLRLRGDYAKAILQYRRYLQSYPDNADAQVGLGETLAATGQYQAALSSFNKVLKERPGYYEALQGKAYVLFWEHDFVQAQAIFVALRKENPRDPENAQALTDIARTQEGAHWKALRPAASASPQLWVAFYGKRLASYPEDRAAMKGLAYEEAQLGRRDAAIQGYRQVLKVYPNDRDSELELARLLRFDHQYAPAIGFYREVLQQDPEDTPVLSELARVYTWSGQPKKALKVDQQLLSRHPSDPDYLLAAAKTEIQLKRYHAARQTLYMLLEADPENQIAWLDVARIDFEKRKYEAALQNYNILLKQNPRDPAALLGKARIDFYQGKLREAQVAAAEAVQAGPREFSSLFLLASIEHARHHRRKALSLLGQAEKLSPGNPEAVALRTRVLSESNVTLRSTVAFSREIGPPTQFKGVAGLANEDLRTYTYGTTIGISLIPRTSSYISFVSNPTDSPPGPVRDHLGNQLPTGITGAAAPYEFLYRQSTRFGRRFAVRAGAGFVRFGPGGPVSIPGQPSAVKSAQQRPLGLAGISFRLANNLSLDVDATQLAIPYTPVSTRLGVIQDRLQGRINYFLGPRMQLHLAYWYGRYSSEEYTHMVAENGFQQSVVRADQDPARGESMTFVRNVLRSDRLSFDAGYEGVIYGFTGRSRNVYLGFFNPSYYQRHEFVPHIYGPLWGPLGYDLSASIGIQQVGHGEAITRAWSASPGISIRVNRHLRFMFGYTHYNTAQILGPLRGNEVRFDTEWQY